MKNLTFREGSLKTNIEGDCLKRGGLEQFTDLRGGALGKKEGVMFLRKVDTPIHTMTIWKVP